MLNIEVKRKENISVFGNISVGEIFLLAHSTLSPNDVYMKTHTAEEDGLNAVNLTTGAITHISKFTCVSILDGTLTCERQEGEN